MVGNEMTDHDLLIALNEQVKQIKESIDAIAPAIASVNERQSALENASARHSERLTRLRGDVDALKLDKLNKSEIEAIREDVSKLQDQSNTWNIINSVGVAFATIVAIVFGGKN